MTTRVRRIRFHQFKALRDFSLSLADTSILVGPNNSGKSTIIGALRALEQGIRFAHSRAPTKATVRGERRVAYALSPDALPISLENVHTDYGDQDARVTFELDNGNKLVLEFPAANECLLVPETQGERILTAKDFKSNFPLSIAVVPVLGPVEHREAIVEQATVLRGLPTHRASRHFRNFWRYFPERFEEFAQLVQQTWPGMSIQRPEINTSTRELSMFCLEGRMTRELYWAGFGFQVWCQILTHVCRAHDKQLLVIDEPEIYLHPDVQRQLVAVLREHAADILIATHSSEIISESAPDELVVVDKNRRTGHRLKDVSGVQSALDLVGSIQNIQLSALARNRRVLFVEGLDDFALLRRFARRLGLSGLAAGFGLTGMESGGFGSHERLSALAEGISGVLGMPLLIAAIYDRDFHCDELVDHVLRSLRSAMSFAHVHQRKEIENYLLLPSALQRAIDRHMAAQAKQGEKAQDRDRILDVRSLLDEITQPMKADVLGQLCAARAQFLRNTGVDASVILAETMKQFESRWLNLDSRLELVPGKSVLQSFRAQVQETVGVTLTDARIVESIRVDELPSELVALLKSLNSFRELEFGGA